MKSNFVNAFINFALGNKRKVEYKNILTRKREDLSEEDIDNIIDILDSFDNTKKEKIALHWISNGRLILPEDMGKLDDAIEISNRFGVDLFKFNGPVEAINSVKKGKQNRIIDNSGDPKNYKELKLEYTTKTEEGTLDVYYVEDSQAGQMAMRRIMNGLWGKEAKGPWCLVYGDGKGGLDKDSWKYWSKRYNTIPKRAAFLNGDLVGFCASENGDTTWWDIEDKPTESIPLFSRKYNRISLGEYADNYERYFEETELFDEISEIVFADVDMCALPYYIEDDDVGEDNIEWEMANDPNIFIDLFTGDNIEARIKEGVNGDSYYIESITEMDENGDKTTTHYNEEGEIVE